MKIIEHKVNSNKVKELSKKLKLNKDIIEFLISKNYSEKEINLLTNKDINKLLPNDNITNVEKAAKLISKYLNAKNTAIYIFGDYDGDGINAGYIMYDSINRIKTGLNLSCYVDLFIPQRSEGYGLNMNWCKELVEKKTNKNILVITVDNGISKKREVDYLKKNNIKVLITDHHIPQKNLVPNTLIVNPHLHDTKNKNALGLCGAAVAYKVCSYLLEKLYNNSKLSDMYVSNVAIATITDMMPITEENILFVRKGITLMNNKLCNKALRHYMDYINKEIVAKDIAFELGPQLNACGRMGEVDKAIELLLSNCNVDILHIYNDIVLLNDKRKEKTNYVVDLCKERIKETDNIIIFRIVNLGGVGGNVANQLLQAYNKPVILFHEEDDEESLVGSARSNDINLQELFKLGQQEGLIESFGGHENAAGITVRKDKMKELKIFFNNIMKNFYEENIIEVNEDIYVNKIINLDELNFKTVKKYEQIMFFNDLKEPLLALKEVTINRVTSSKNNPNNLCFFFLDDSGKETKGAWCWKFGEVYKNLGEPKKVNIVFSLSIFNTMLVMDIKYMESC